MGALNSAFNPAPYPESSKPLITRIQAWVSSIGLLGSAFFLHGTFFHFLFGVLILLSIVLIPLSESRNTPKSTILKLT
jgi:hypothetical protein